MTIAEKLTALESARTLMNTTKARYEEAEALVYAGRLPAKSLKEYSDAYSDAVDACVADNAPWR